MTLARETQAVVEVVGSPTPKGRASQAVIEVVVRLSILKDAVARFRLNAQAYKDTAARFVVLRGGWIDAVARFRLNVASFKDARARYRLWVRGYKDTAVRVRISQQRPTDGKARFRLTVVETVAITGPATITASYVDATWTVAAQYAYRVRLLQGATVILDTGKAYSASLRTHNVGPIANGATVNIEVNIWNTDDVAGPIVSIARTAAYSGPTVPTVVGSTPAGRPRCQLVITNPAGATSNEVWRSTVGATGPWIRMATGVALNATWVDYAVGVGVTYWYFVRAVSATGFTDSAVV